MDYMASLIRAAILSHETHKLASRLTATVTPPALGIPLTASATTIPTVKVDIEAQRVWQQHAERDLQVERERERKSGYAAGHAQGMDEAQAAYRDKQQRLEQLIANAGQAFARQIEGLEDIAVAIAFEATVKLLGEAMVSRQGVRAVIEQVLVRSREQEKLSVRLAPSDFYLLLQQNTDAPWHAPAGVELVPDDRVELGGCLVDTDSGSLDGRLETQVDALRQLLLRTRAQRHAGGGTE
jgi:flagellar biosynthesis/type III secretory pathway protein FliH